MQCRLFFLKTQHGTGMFVTTLLHRECKPGLHQLLLQGLDRGPSIDTGQPRCHEGSSQHTLDSAEKV